MTIFPFTVFNEYLPGCSEDICDSKCYHIESKEIDSTYVLHKRSNNMEIHGNVKQNVHNVP